MGLEIKVLPDPAAVIEEAARRVAAAAAEATAAGNLFSLFLSGGSTPKALHQLLASDGWRDRIDWKSVEIYFGDERCVPPDSELSNYKMAFDTLISKVPIPPTQVFRMKGEGDPEAAAKSYGLLLKEKFLDGGPDLLLLGMGDDGHTASLFPGSTGLAEDKHRCVANYVARDGIPPGTDWRLTLSYPFINRAAKVLILVTGVGKAARVQEVLEGPQEPERLPIQGVDPPDGEVTWLLDVAAASMDCDAG